MEELKNKEQEKSEQEEKEFEVDEKSTDDLADWIEEQGIYIRQ